MPDRGATPVGDPAAGELTAAERAVLAAIDDAALVAQLVDLVRVPSITGTDAESQLQEVLAGQLRAAGLEVDAWKLDLDALRAEPGFPGTEAERVEGYGVVGLTPGDGEPALVLQGHVDVVPIGDQAKWDGGDPFSGTIRNGVLHGRGACDMKAGVAVNLAVLRALMRSGVRFERRLAIHSVVSEEDGGLGAFATLRRGHGGEAAVITEPTSGRIVTASAGALTFRIEVTGRAAHAATPLEGRSAFEAFWPINLAIRELEARRNSRPDPLFDDNPLPYAIVVGKIHAGDWASSVPDLLVADGRLGVRLDEDPAQARAEFEQALAAAAARDPWLRDHPLRVTWPGGQFAPGQLDGAHPLIGQVQTCIADTGGQPARPAAAPYGSDLRLYAGIGGIPTLHYGPGDVRFAHAPREQVDVAETLAVTRALALLAARRLGAHL